MNKYRKIIPLVAVLLIAFGVNLEKFGIDLNDFTGQYGSSAPGGNQQQSQHTNQSPSQDTDPGAHWSSTSPKVNLWHIFDGEINRKGKPVGFHSRPGGKDPASARVNQIKSRPNRAGVYTASVSINDNGQWKEKFSSFFPDKMNRNDVLAAILHAYENSDNPGRQPWSGPSGLGFTIQGYTTSKGDINTAFPVFAKNQ